MLVENANDVWHWCIEDIYQLIWHNGDASADPSQRVEEVLQRVSDARYHWDLSILVMFRSILGAAYYDETFLTKQDTEYLKKFISTLIPTISKKWKEYGWVPLERHHMLLLGVYRQNMPQTAMVEVYFDFRCLFVPYTKLYHMEQIDVK
jgi:hypothetical protein